MEFRMSYWSVSKDSVFKMEIKMYETTEYRTQEKRGGMQL